MLEGYFNGILTATNFRNFPKASEDFPFFPKISEDFGTFRKIFKNFGNLSECLFFALSGVFPKFSKEFANIQQRRHELLLPVTDRPLIFFMYVVNK